MTRCPHLPRTATCSLVLALACLADALVGSRAPAQAPRSSPAAAAYEAGSPRTASDYRLGPGDKVRIIVYNETNLTGEFVIAPSGILSFPLVGDVVAAGRTVGVLQSGIEEKLKDGYLRDPHVSIEVLTFRPFYILGEVNKPGEYPYTAGLTITKAVATAQGYTYRANTKRVFIKHPDDSGEHGYPATDLTPLSPGDIITVPERLF